MLEIEVKFLVDDLPALRQQVVAAGALVKKTRIFERNVCYDDEAQSLLAKGALLRLRQDSAIRLTYKGMPPTETGHSAGAKVREEIEMVVSDANSAEILLNRLGFTPKISYEKYRETFQLDAVEIVLDELPYGNFVELEAADETAIRAACDRLQLDWAQRITSNYLRLLQQFNQYHNLSIADLTFANFEQVAQSIAPVLR